MNDAPDPFEITDLDGDHLTVALRYDGAIRITINFRELMLLEPGEARALADWLHAATEPQFSQLTGRRTSPKRR